MRDVKSLHFEAPPPTRAEQPAGAGCSKALLEMARRNLAHVKAGTVDQAPSVERVPARHYCDPQRARVELDRIFRRLPLVLGFSCELPEAGSYTTLEAAGMPVLLVRAEDNGVRAFVNACRHRGAQVVAGAGCASRFTCPYHGWTYGADGRLVGIADRSHFGDVDPALLGLTPLPCVERAGLIFAVLQPGAPLDLDAFLCGYGEALAHLGLERCHLVGRQEIAGPNWKIAYDGYLDFYHLPILHRNSFGPRMPSKALYDAFGPHQRVSAPNPRLLHLESRPEHEWDLEALVGGVWTIFPHVSIADFEAGGKVYMVSQLFPGATAGESRTIQSFLATSAPDEERRAQVAQTMQFLLHVVRDEDYATGLRIQRALEADPGRDVLFGRNEWGGQRFHRFVAAVLEAADSELPAVFAAGLD
jgi:phenylpropionate dioxygenase-like ring-hydroxylating dioxygenase large terminal subunit